MPELSVILCTHNPQPDYLRQTLAALAAQTLPREQWEFILVDNVSQPPLAGGVDLGWHAQARVVVEPRLGLTPARQRGIAEARGETIVFVDDDNVLAPDYLAGALAIGREFPFLGAWGGSVAGRFEREPPAWLRPHLFRLAVRETARDCWGNNPGDFACIPVGAGLCVRTAVARRWAQAVDASEVRQRLGRAGASLGACEDSDLALTAGDMELGTGVFTRLRLEHLIPAARLTLEYQEKLTEGMSCSVLLLHSLRGAAIRRHVPSRVERWYGRYRRWRLPEEQRRIEEAIRRGEARAFQILGV